MTTFSSGLSASIRSYLTLKRALGRQYSAEEWVLGCLDRFLAARGVDLIAATFAAWCLTLQHLASGTRRARMLIVRNLCLYRRRGEPGCFVPDERLFPPAHQAIRPHIFADSEIVRLLAVARTLTRSAKSPLRPENMRLAVVVLATTGLRRGELMRLTVGDYDPPQRTLAIRESKFHKSRLVPLSADTAREIEHLIETRDRRRLPVGTDSPLLWLRRPPNGGYRGECFGQAMRALFRRAGIRTATGHPPRTHDFRHYSGSRIIPSRLRVGGGRLVVSTCWEESRCSIFRNNLVRFLPPASLSCPGMRKTIMSVERLSPTCQQRAASHRRRWTCCRTGRPRGGQSVIIPETNAPSNPSTTHLE